MFSQLKEKRSKFSYKMTYFRNKKELEGAVEELKKDGELPILVWLYKEG